MMNISKSTTSSLSNIISNPTSTFFLNQNNNTQHHQPMKVMSNVNTNNNTLNQFGPSFTTTTTSAASATSNSVAGLNPQLPFQSQHSIFTSGGGAAQHVTSSTPLEDTNMNSNSGFDFLSMNPFTNPSDPFQLGTTNQQVQVNQSGVNLSMNSTPNYNRERRLSSIFDIENSRDSDGGIGLFGSNNVFNVNKEDSCFSFGDNPLSDRKNELGEYDHSLFSFMEHRRFSKVGDVESTPQPTILQQSNPHKTEQFPLPPLSSPLLGNVHTENEFKFPSRDLIDESSKISFVSNAAKSSSSLTCKSNTDNSSSNQRNVSFNEMYNNPFNYESLNTNNQSTMQKLLNMQQIILNNQERIQNNTYIDPNSIQPKQSQQQQQPEQLVWNSIMNAQRNNERFLAENLFSTQNQMFNQNAFLNKENPLLEKHIPLNTIAVQSHSIQNTPRSNENSIGFMSQGYHFQGNTQKSNENSKSSTQTIVNNSTSNTSKNRKKRKAKDTSPERKKKIKSQGHSSESQLSNQEIILASSSQFDLDERSQPMIATQLTVEDGSPAMVDDDISSNSSDSNQKKFCFRNLIVEKSSKKMKFVNSDIKEEGTNQGAWSEREHQAFLRGLKDLGYGKWREIADRYVKTRTRIQVASHSQKYHQRLERHAKKKKKLQKNTSNNMTTGNNSLEGNTPFEHEEQEQDDIILQHDTIHSDE